jgi:hypothetical protein
VTANDVLVLSLALALAVTHQSARRLADLDPARRRQVTSAASGISVAYVLVILLPELSEGQQALTEAGPDVGIEEHAYLLALLGLVVFYGLERHTTESRRSAPEGASGSGAFRLSIGGFAIYNALIGYLLHDRGGFADTALFAVAMAVHFAVNDVALWTHHQEPYRRIGRWILSAAVLVGSLTRVLFDVEEAVVASVLAFVAGGVILNVLKEELPPTSEGRFVPFASGALVFTVLLLLA